jgi:chemotaxis response regulator CheB
MLSVRVLVVEDVVVFRRVISSILGKRRDLQIVGEVADGLEVVRKAQELQPDLILLDVVEEALSFGALGTLLRHTPEATYWLPWTPSG